MFASLFCLLAPAPRSSTVTPAAVHLYVCPPLYICPPPAASFARTSILRPTAYDARLVDIWACGIVYYCLHFQELPWRAAQTSDPLYAAYAAAAAATPPPPLAAAPPASAPANGTANGGSSTANGTANGTTSSNVNGTTTTPAPDRDRNHTNSALVFPPTISNLSPRACRPLIRKMLEPDPKLRSSIEEVLGCAWMRGVEVCWEVGEGARHVHVNARAMAGER